MATSTSDRFYVWVWLPGATSPVTAGVLEPRGTDLRFRYGNRYLERPNAISLGPDLPLGTDWHETQADLHMPGSLRDGSPDAWGRQVILNRLTGRRGTDADTSLLDERTYLLQSGSNRFGALDFQTSATDYIARRDTGSLDTLHQAADLVAAGLPVPEPLADALTFGTAIGGARPKVLLEADGKHYIAKFSTSTDPFSVVGAEAASIVLARKAGIRVTDSHVVRSLGRDVLLVERFDRVDGGRRLAVSGLTILGLGEMTSRYGTYPDLLDKLRASSTAPDAVGEELFMRIAFNIAISNTDDHLRNHAAFWDGEHLDLTPAYDLSPMNRSGETAKQILAYGRDGERDSTFVGLIAQSHVYGLSQARGREIVKNLIATIRDGWDEAAELARLTATDKMLLFGRQILNPGATHGLT